MLAVKLEKIKPYHAAIKPRAIVVEQGLLQQRCCMLHLPEQHQDVGWDATQASPLMFSSRNCVCTTMSGSHEPEWQHFQNLDLRLFSSFCDRARVEGERTQIGLACRGSGW